MKGSSTSGVSILTMLAADSRGVPYVIVRGRRGGSAMAAAAVNALATEVE